MHWKFTLEKHHTVTFTASVSLTLFNDCKTSQMFHRACCCLDFFSKWVYLRHQPNLLRNFLSLNRKVFETSSVSPFWPETELTIFIYPWLKGCSDVGSVTLLCSLIYHLIIIVLRVFFILPELIFFGCKYFYLAWSQGAQGNSGSLLSFLSLVWEEILTYWVTGILYTGPFLLFSLSFTHFSLSLQRGKYVIVFPNKVYHQISKSKVIFTIVFSISLNFCFPRSRLWGASSQSFTSAKHSKWMCYMYCMY